MGIVLFIPAVFDPSTAGAKGQHYVFDILRNGKPIGQHELEIEHRDNETHVVARSAIDVTVLGFPLYRMRYQAQERWDEQGLRELSVEVDDDGRESRIVGQRRDDRFFWSDLDGREYSVRMPVFPTNHWNAKVLESGRVLNTLTAEMNQVNIATVDDPISRTIRASAQRGAKLSVYRYEGDLNVHTWYDDDGLWHGLRFKGRDGSNIEYVCRNCADPTNL